MGSGGLERHPDARGVAIGVADDQMEQVSKERGLMDSREPGEDVQCLHRSIHAQLQHGLGHVLPLQLFRCAQGNQTAAVDQRQAVAVLGLVHVMRGNEDGDALLRQGPDQIPEAAAGDRIHA